MSQWICINYEYKEKYIGEKHISGAFGIDYAICNTKVLKKLLNFVKTTKLYCDIHIEVYDSIQEMYDRYNVQMHYDEYEESIKDECIRFSNTTDIQEFFANLIKTPKLKK